MALVILHLSDAHFGKSVGGVDEGKVRKALLDHIAKIHADEKLTPNMIIFSGDIVQGCKTACNERHCDRGDFAKCEQNKNYEQARGFLDEVAKRSGTALGDVPLVMVPGNHDLIRHHVPVPTQIARDGYRPDLVKRLQEDRDWTDMLRPQAQWLAFVKSLPNTCVTWDPKFNVPLGMMELEGIKISFLGLNSSWSCFSDAEYQKIWLGRGQLDYLRQQIGEAAIKIAVSHHPASWLNLLEAREIAEDIDACFDVHFHGHEHSGWFDDKKCHLRVEGGALYDDSTKRNAYSWLMLDLKDRKATILCYEYSNKHGGGWGPANVPKKLDNGRGSIIGLAACTANDKAAVISAAKASAGAAAPVLPPTPGALVEALQSRYNVRWERGSYAEGGESPHVFWPVRLRAPGPIHAAQCFVASGLLKTGCNIHLYVDQLGHPDYDLDAFCRKLQAWIGKAGGTISRDNFGITLYRDIESKHKGTRNDHLEKLLTQEIYKADTILRIAKISAIEKDPRKTNQEELVGIITDITERRPRRLLAPAMTWTCLQALHESVQSKPVITLGGYDEKVLWQVWRDCFAPAWPVGHVYVSQLDGVHLANADFTWSSREDIYREFKRPDLDKAFDTQNKMIPWCVNNCALLPAYVAGKQAHVFAKKPVDSVAELMKLEQPLQHMEEFVAAVEAWVI